MFHIHDEPIKAEPRHDSCGGHAGKAQPGPQRRLAPFEFFFHQVCSHRLLIFLVMQLLRDCDLSS